MVNSNVLIDIRLSPSLFVGCLSRSKATIAFLQTNDNLRVRLPTIGCYVENADSHWNSFTGFRVA